MSTALRGRVVTGAGEAPVAGVVDVPLCLRLRTGVAAQPLTTDGIR
jgi:hypothetical protein